MKKEDYIEKLCNLVREKGNKLTVKELRVLLARHTTPGSADKAPVKAKGKRNTVRKLSLIHISEPTRPY